MKDVLPLDWFNQSDGSTDGAPKVDDRLPEKNERFLRLPNYRPNVTDRYHSLNYSAEKQCFDQNQHNRKGSALLPLATTYHSTPQCNVSFAIRAVLTTRYLS